jgi:hypothetical protein
MTDYEVALFAALSINVVITFGLVVWVRLLSGDHQRLRRELGDETETRHGSVRHLDDKFRSLDTHIYQLESQLGLTRKLVERGHVYERTTRRRKK